MVTYYSLGAAKKLNEIVMAGSHDAAITQGSGNAQTQDLDIFDQASAGVRIFDIRITGAIVKSGSGGDVGSLKAYHGQSLGGGGTQSVTDLRTGQVGNMTIKPMKLGTYGMSLSKILTDAAKFVAKEGTEFVILKFDKCDNWPGIAEACIVLLGDKICKIRTNLNTKTLDELKGKVIVLFSVEGRTSLGWSTPPEVSGILAFENLKEGGSFNANFAGLQYYGKGGTKAGAFWKNDEKKMKENIKKQGELMQNGAATDPQVCGMMYWTATGLNASIKDRNDFMWNDENKLKMMELWVTRVPSSVDQGAPSGGAMLKSFMPNFVMIDFSDPDKCEKIFNLNQLAAVNLTTAVKKFFG